MIDAIHFFIYLLGFTITALLMLSFFVLSIYLCVDWWFRKYIDLTKLMNAVRYARKNGIDIWKP